MMKRMELENIRFVSIYCVAQLNKLRPSSAALQSRQIFEFLIGSKLLREPH